MTTIQDKIRKDIEKIIKWTIHNGILANSEKSKDKVISQALTAITKIIEEEKEK